MMCQPKLTQQIATLTETFESNILVVNSPRFRRKDTQCRKQCTAEEVQRPELRQWSKEAGRTLGWK